MPEPDLPPDETDTARERREESAGGARANPLGPSDEPKRRRGPILGIAVAAVVLIVAAGTSIAVFGGSSDDPETTKIVAAPERPDPVPIGPIIEKTPKGCGVSPKTAHKLVPGSKQDGGGSGKGNCRWYSLDDGKVDCAFCPPGTGHRERVLRVSTTPYDGSGDVTPIGQAMRLFGPEAADGGSSTAPSKTLTGLGDEATVHYSPALSRGGATVVFRYGNSITTVRYYGWDRSGKDAPRRQIPKKAGMDGVLTVAAEVAKSLGAPSTPVVTTPKATASPVTRIPPPCDTVPAGLLDRLAKGATHTRGRTTLLDRVPGARSDTCRWSLTSDQCCHKGRERGLTVEIARVTEARAGRGRRAVEHEFLQMYHNARHRASRSGGFTALKGPGEAAYATYGQVSDTGDPRATVIFRSRNVLVKVVYEGTDDGTALPEDTATDGAYTAAVQVAEALRS